MSTFNSGEYLQSQQQIPSKYFMDGVSAVESDSDVMGQPVGLRGYEPAVESAAVVHRLLRNELGHASSVAPVVDYLDEIAEKGFPNTQTVAYRVAKRVFDIVFAATALMVLAPLFLIIAITIKLTSAGPVFFRQERVGKDGTLFEMLKFRTMRVADKSLTDRAWSAANDPRRTVVGSFLRRTSLDELPQFINVLVGDMSVVGPRPERPFFVKKFANEIRHYNLRHTADVGITGLAQIRGYRGDTCIQSRVRLDLAYLEKWSLWLDLKIILLTIWGGFHGMH